MPAFRPARLCLNAARPSSSSLIAARESRSAFRGLDITAMRRTHQGFGDKYPRRSVYLDFQATSPLDPRVLDAMMPYMTESYGNPHSRTHMYGWNAEEAVERARGEVASLIKANSKDIVFTSGATESNNNIIKGASLFLKEAGKRHIITTQIEHKCVLEAAMAMEPQGFKVTYLPVGRDGLINLQELEEAITPETALVSIIAVNNEIGVIQPLKEIGAICKKKNVLFHTDAAQAVGKIPIDVTEMNIACLSLSGHKLYGPKGVGAMFVRRRPRVRLRPLISGGGQERGLRSGTLPTPLVVGLGAACSVAERELDRDIKHVTGLRDRMWNGLTSRIPNIILNGHATQRYAGNLNVSFEAVEGEGLLMGMDEVAVSSGSACTSASLEGSYVLRALGVSEEAAHTSLRFGIGRFTTPDEVDFAVDLTSDTVASLRELSPIWAEMQEGGSAASMKASASWTS
eukprot:TRINITY_DN2290_c0_g1_i1.p1 TRINITY_DN2290_c0_g1~~TRINITY_DN2290_c0_g1_i1.p1  ORF type:complete len:458 (+),score=109.44 TRINITY_DN2290_c0_g1_i1:111-1484(+)